MEMVKAILDTIAGSMGKLASSFAMGVANSATASTGAVTASNVGAVAINLSDPNTINKIIEGGIKVGSAIIGIKLAFDRAKVAFMQSKAPKKSNTSTKSRHEEYIEATGGVSSRKRVINPVGDDNKKDKPSNPSEKLMDRVKKTRNSLFNRLSYTEQRMLLDLEQFNLKNFELNEQRKNDKKPKEVMSNVEMQKVNFDNPTGHWETDAQAFKSQPWNWIKSKLGFNVSSPEDSEVRKVLAGIYAHKYAIAKRDRHFNRLDPIEERIAKTLFKYAKIDSNSNTKKKSSPNIYYNTDVDKYFETAEKIKQISGKKMSNEEKANMSYDILDKLDLSKSPKKNAKAMRETASKYQSDTIRELHEIDLKKEGKKKKKKGKKGKKGKKLSDWDREFDPSFSSSSKSKKDKDKNKSTSYSFMNTLTEYNDETGYQSDKKVKKYMKDVGIYTMDDVNAKIEKICKKFLKKYPNPLKVIQRIGASFDISQPDATFIDEFNDMWEKIRLVVITAGNIRDDEFLGTGGHSDSLVRIQELKSLTYHLLFGDVRQGDVNDYYTFISKYCVDIQ